MLVGDIVKPTKKSFFILASGNCWYDDAVVISTNPFILVSRESDMRWESTIEIDNFEVVGEADRETLNKCMRRLEK